MVSLPIEQKCPHPITISSRISWLVKQIRSFSRHTLLTRILPIYFLYHTLRSLCSSMRGTPPSLHPSANTRQQHVFSCRNATTAILMVFPFPFASQFPACSFAVLSAHERHKHPSLSDHLQVFVILVVVDIQNSTWRTWAVTKTFTLPCDLKLIHLQIMSFHSVFRHCSVCKMVEASVFSQSHLFVDICLRLPHRSSMSCC